MIWVLFALMTGLAVVAVLRPLARPAAATPDSGGAKALYEAEIASLERDRTRGLIGEEEARATRIEASRRLLDRAASERGAMMGPDEDGGRRKAAAVLLCLLVPALTFGIYLKWGEPGRPDLPLQARQAAPAQMDVDEALVRIEQHLAANPDDGRGHDLVAPVYLETGRHAEAIRAYTQALRLLGESASRRTGLGEARVFAAGGVVTAGAREDFEQALRQEPKAPRARYYLGLAAEQDGDKEKATGLYRAIIADGPPEAPWLPRVQARLEMVTGAPPADAAAAIASLPPEQRQAAIAGMVDSLAARLAREGKDVDGWLRLIRAQSVLGRNDQARTALSDARRALSDDGAALARLDGLAGELKLESAP